MKRGDKKAQGLSTSTIILLIIGIIILVILIAGFTMGWTNFKDKIFPFLSSSNIASVKQACSLACDMEDVDAYCDVKRTVKFGEKDKSDITDISCDGLSKDPNLEKYGFPTCPGLCPPKQE